MFKPQLLQFTKQIFTQAFICHTRRTMADLSGNWTLFTNAKQTELYAQYRPRYTQEVFNTITDYCKETSSDFQLAVDVGCGSGQSTVPLAKQFKRVLGLDVSALQIAKAPTDIPNLTFRTCPADDLSLVQSGSVDLVTVAQAFHWMDEKKFYAEADRILKPGGSLVIYGYATCSLKPAEADKYFQEFYHTVLPSYWTGGRKAVEDKYVNFNIPFPGSKRVDHLTIEKDLQVNEFIGYLGSWSAVTEYNSKHAPVNVLDDVQKSLEEICQNLEKKNGKQETDLHVTWPVFMLMGHKPK